MAYDEMPAADPERFNRIRKYTLEEAADLIAEHSDASVLRRLQSELTVAATLGAHRAALLDFFSKVIAGIRSGTS